MGVLSRWPGWAVALVLCFAVALFYVVCAAMPLALFADPRVHWLVEFPIMAPLVVLVTAVFYGGMVDDTSWRKADRSAPFHLFAAGLAAGVASPFLLHATVGTPLGFEAVLCGALVGVLLAWFGLFRVVARGM